MPLNKFTAMKSLLLLLFLTRVAQSFDVASPRQNGRSVSVALKMMPWDVLSANTKAPQSLSNRDNQAIQACRSALASPRVPSCRLIECEFPPLGSLNKLGDGSLQSAQQVDRANLEFCLKLVKSLTPLLPGPKVWLVTSSAASPTLRDGAEKKLPGRTHYLRQGLPPVKGKDICVLCSPSSSSDYSYAQQLVDNGVAVVLVNGLAKTPKSIDERATMAYFLKPLTYNSMVAGYLVRAYPRPWTTLGGFEETLDTVDDATILVAGTNTPDLRASVRLVQKYADEQALQQRRQS